MNLTDEFLLENFRKTRNSTYFMVLARRHQVQLFGIAYRMVGNREEAEEVVQETFIRLYNSCEQFQDGASFSAWIFRIIHNLCLDLLRVKQKRNPIQLLSFPSEINYSDELSSTILEVSDYRSNPAHKLESSEQSQVVEETLQGLPEPQRTALVLHDIEGLSYQEIANITGVALGTVRSRLHYGRLKMRNLLEPYFVESRLTPALR